MKRVLLLSAACVLLIACQDQRSPTAAKPLTQIMDGAHAGNMHFWFLPPMVPQPSFSGVFNPTIKPVVRICALVGSACGTTIATFTTTTGPGSETVRLAGNQYIINWHTAQFNLSDQTTYRISVLGGDDVLGFADVDVVSSANQLKNVNTGQFVPLLDDRTLPIKFRIEVGAFGTNCVRDCAEASVTNDGGVVVTNTGFAGASFPRNWLPEGFDNVVVTIERVNLQDLDDTCIPLARPQAEGCYRFKTFPDVGAFALDVTAGICVDVPSTDARFDAAQLFKVEELGEGLGEITALENAPAAFVTCEGFAAAHPGGGSLKSLARALVEHVGSWLTPSSAYAAHVGVGGLTGSFSRMGWMLPTAIDFDMAPGEGGPVTVTSGDAVSGLYSGLGVTFTAVTGGKEGCSGGSDVFANNSDGSLSTNAVSVCEEGPAAFSEENDGIVRAHLPRASKVCIDVKPTDDASTGFLEIWDGESASRRVMSAPGVAQVLCIESAGPDASGIVSVQFAGTGSSGAIFDNLSFTAAPPFSD